MIVSGIDYIPIIRPLAGLPVAFTIISIAYKCIEIYGIYLVTGIIRDRLPSKWTHEASNIDDARIILPMNGAR